MAEDFQTSQENMRELAAWAQTDGSGLRRNEAQTRLELIDRLLFDCLGWDKEDCSVEESYEGTYADYILGRPERLAVLEAKREGVTFELPAGFGRRMCKLSVVSDSAKGVAQALGQALGYCQQRGIGVAIVSNGHQLVAFLASRQDGVPPS
jgi:predicted type IV restriction endonuclease